MVFNLLENVVNDLSDPDNTPSGYGTAYINADLAIIICVPILIILAIIFITIMYKNLKRDKTNKQEENKTSDEITEKETKILNEFRKLTPKQQQTIIDSMAEFNENKNE